MTEWIAWLRDALPEADRIAYDDASLMEIVEHARMLREKMPWGKKIPEWMFRAFVLFPRVNDERPTLYQGEIYEELAPRLVGLTMEQAVLEVNKWTCERATYQLTDDRTADALTVLRRTFGRCGEESTLLVSALRSVGIPARQVYAPRWSHCDDNHAWVEAWVDGEWHYLGACEPEPVLDSGWFTAAASETMLVHTRAYGVEPEGERVENRIGNAYVINRTAAYADTKLLTVRVKKDGKPMCGAIVRFEIANMAELYPINEQTTDERGEVTLLTGLGTMNLHVHDGEKYLRCQVDVAGQDAVDVDFDRAVLLEEASMFSQRAPRESKIQPSVFPEEVLENQKATLENCENLRAARIASFPKGDPDVEKAFGNHAQVEAFLADPQFDMRDKRMLLSTLTYKDFGDITAATLADALSVALEYKNDYPEEIWREGILKARVWHEPMSPVRAALKEALPADDPHILWKNLKEKIEICEMAPATLIPDLLAAVRAGRASERVLDILFVAAARANGIAARLNPASAEKEIWQDGWQALIPARQADAKLILVSQEKRELVYGVHFTVGLKVGGAFETLHLYGTSLKGRIELPVFAGEYRVLACTRQIDGTYDGAITPIILKSGEEREVQVVLPQDRTEELVQCAELPRLKAQDRMLPEAGNPAIIALIEPGQEPTEHFLNELLDAKTAILESGARIQLLVGSEAKLDNPKLKRALAEVPGAELLVGYDEAVLLKWRSLLNAGELRLPLVIAVDRAGKGRFAIANYNVGSVLSMLKAVGAGKEG